ncbi:MAG TPA: tyrosine-type recombinase/integrase [Anaerolineales bacterium]|nr:tyrosine-type recombinase/integrase [Anaerolineales bacterium]
MQTAILRFLTFLREQRGSADNTILAYRTDLQQMDQVVSRGETEHIPPPALDRQKLRRYVDWLGARGYRPATVARKMAVVRSFLDYLENHEEGQSSDLILELQSPPAPRRRPRVLSRDEVERLLSAPAKRESPRGLRDAAILALLYVTGLRAADAVALRLDELDLGEGVIRRAEWEGPVLKLGDSLKTLRRYVEEGRPQLSSNANEKALFLNQRGQSLSRQGLWLVVKRWAQATGLGQDVSPYSLRHSLANHMLTQGRTRREVQELLGLSSPNVLRVGKEEPES